jgi:hypothetical protein
MARRSRTPYPYTERNSERNNYPPLRPSQQPGGFKFDVTTLSVLSGVLVVGIGIGFGFSSAFGSGSTANAVNREMLDNAAPDRELCVQFGSSAVSMDMRIFMTLNPFSVFVSQPVMQPGCVIRRNNWSILEQQGAITNEDVRLCKQRMNTFAYTGTLSNKPTVSCVYQNDAAQNLFIRNGQGGGEAPQEANKF